MERLQQHAVGIAVDDALERRMRLVADRIGAFFRGCRELGRLGHELRGDRVGGVGGIDQRGHLGGDGEREFARDGVDLVAAALVDEAGGNEVGGAAEGCPPPFFPLSRMRALRQTLRRVGVRVARRGFAGAVRGKARALTLPSPASGRGFV